MNQLITFKKPYYIEALGEEGLTARDISESLGLDIDSIHQKLKRDQWYSKEIEEWKVTAYVVIEDIKGLDAGIREMQTFALNTRAAKVFVTRWNNRISDQYLNFLFDCEHIATEITPKLIEQVRQLQAQVDLLQTSPQHKKRLISTDRKGMMLSPVFEENLFGKLEARYELKRKEDVDQKLQAYGELQHINKVRQGLERKIERITDTLLRLELEQRNINLMLSKGY
jgi:hypothetical protein